MDCKEFWRLAPFWLAMFNVAVVIVSVSILIRNIGEWRRLHRLRVSILATVEYFQEKGIPEQLRCLECCQVLDTHVEGCAFQDWWEKRRGVIEVLTRPLIKVVVKAEPNKKEM